MWQEKFKEQQTFFKTGQTQSLAYREIQLNKLQSALKKYEAQLIFGLKQDLGKSETESYLTEIGLLERHVKQMIKKLGRWSRAKKVKTPLFLQPAKSYTVRKSYGNALIISPFNYPVLLAIDPLIGSIAGGNTTILGLSSETPYTNRVLQQMLSETFPENYVDTYIADRETNDELLDLPFNKIFFTGSEKVGKVVSHKASDYLASVTLELGGKSPAIVTEKANIKQAAERIAWGKWINAGQTCVAPDYCLVDKKIQVRFTEELIKATQKMFGQEIENSADFGRIINQRQFDRLFHLLEEDQEYLFFGGETKEEKLYIHPTLLVGEMTSDLRTMQEEIFGPLLPILTYDSLDEAIEFILDRPRPLAFYPFSQNKRELDYLVETVFFGGAVTNDTLLHLSNENLPFGGIGSSGQGVYHGEESYKAFTYNQSVLKRSTLIHLPVYYPPYTKIKTKILKKLFTL